MDEAVQDYVNAIADEHRPLFERIRRLVIEAHPEATMVISYKMPTFVAGRSRLYVGVWSHGVSLYGGDGDAGFSERHPELTSGKGTIRLSPEAAAAVPDDELRDLVRAALGG